MKNEKNYPTVDEYIVHSRIANENSTLENGIFDEAIQVLQDAALIQN